MQINREPQETPKDEISRVIGELDQDMCQRMIGNFVASTKDYQRIRSECIPYTN